MADRRIVSLPFTYQVEAVLPKKTKPTTFLMADSILVEAPVLGRSETKPAVKGVDAYDNPFELLDVEGVLMGTPDFMKVAQRDDMADIRSGSTPSFDFDVLDRITADFVAGKNRISWPNAPTMLKKEIDWTARVSVEIPEYREMVHNGREEALDQARKAAEGSIAFVDGKLHVREREPFWDVYQSWGREDRSTKIMLWRGHEQGHMNEVVRIDRLDDARKTAEAIGAPFSVHGTATIDEGHEWSFDADRWNAHRWGWNIIGALENNGPTMLKLDRSFWNALLDIRDLATAEELTPAGLHELVGTMRRAIEASSIQGKDFRSNFEGSTSALRRHVELFDPSGDLVEIAAPAP